MFVLRNTETSETVCVSSLDGYENFELLGEVDEIPPEGGEWVDNKGFVVDYAARAWEKVKSLRDKYEFGLVDTPFGVVQADSKSKQNINGLVTLAMLSKSEKTDFSEPFTLYDNSEVILNADQMIQLGVTVAHHVSAVYEKARNLRSILFNSSNSQEEISRLDIDSGWPCVE